MPAEFQNGTSLTDLLVNLHISHQMIRPNIVATVGSENNVNVRKLAEVLDMYCD